jgi:hypothetical protein
MHCLSISKCYIALRKSGTNDILDTKSRKVLQDGQTLRDKF